MNRRSTWMAGTALIACAAVTVAQGQRPAGPGGPDGRSGRPMGGVGLTSSAILTPPSPQVLFRLADTMNLTEAQTGKLEQVLQTSEPKLQELRQSTAKAAEALRAALVNPAVDTPKLKEVAAAAQKAENTLAAASLDVWIQVRSILDSDQLTALQQMMAPRPGGLGGLQRPDGPPMEGQPIGPPSAP